MSGGDIRIAFKSTGEDSQLRLVAQMGASDVVLDLPKEMHGRVWKEEQLCGLKERAESFGLRLSVLEGYGPPPSNRIRMGLPGRDEDVEKYCDSIRNMGRRWHSDSLLQLDPRLQLDADRLRCTDERRRPGHGLRSSGEDERTDD